MKPTEREERNSIVIWNIRRNVEEIIENNMKKIININVKYEAYQWNEENEREKSK